MGKLRRSIIAVLLLVYVNFFTIFYYLNLIRKDEVFGLTNLIQVHVFQCILVIVILNTILISLSIVIINKFELVKDNFLSKEIFNTTSGSRKITSFLIITLIFYLYAMTNLIIHEFGHGFFRYLFGGYINKIVINLYMGGWTYWAGPALTTTQGIIARLGGFFFEIMFGLPLVILLWTNYKESKTSGLFTMMIIMMSFIRVLLYNTFPPLFDIPSDTTDIAMYNGVNPYLLFAIFFSILVPTIIIMFKALARYYRNSLDHNKAFIVIFFLSLTTYIILMSALYVINEYIIDLFQIIIQ